MLVVNGLEKDYGKLKAVDRVSFSVEAGESFGLLGPNGAGKTTTISMIAGLVQPDAGEVTLNGISMQGEPLRAKRLLGLVPQEIALYSALNAEENLVFWGKLYGLKGQDLRERIDRALETVGLSDRRRDRVSTYSGGMKRRLNIAAGLLHDPQLLILDEPTVGVDPQSRNHILDSIKQLQSTGLTVLYTSHYMEEVEKLCDRVAIMDEGRIIAMGTLDELHSRVAEDRVVQLTPASSDDRERLANLISLFPGSRNQRWRNGTLEFLASEEGDGLQDLLDLLQDNRIRLRGLQVQEPDLESLFLQLTGKALRD